MEVQPLYVTMGAALNFLDSLRFDLSATMFDRPGPLLNTGDHVLNEVACMSCRCVPFHGADVDRLKSASYPKCPRTSRVIELTHKEDITLPERKSRR